jgi:hypothetical protein
MPLLVLIKVDGAYFHSRAKASHINRAVPKLLVALNLDFSHEYDNYACLGCGDLVRTLCSLLAACHSTLVKPFVPHR